MAFAVPAAPHPFLAEQGDGTRVQLLARGDEHFNWLEDAQGYTVVRNNGWLHYAELGADGRLRPGPFLVGRDNPASLGLKKGVLPPLAQRAQSRLRGFSGADYAAADIAPPQFVSTTGNLDNLVVMIRYADHLSRPLPSNADYDVLFNAVGGDPQLAPTGSLRDVYHEISYNQLTIDSTLSNWITVSNDEFYYASDNNGASERGQEAMREALDILDATLDFSQFDDDSDGVIDAITFIHSGYGAEWGGHPNRIWSHKWVFVQQIGAQLYLDPWVSNEGVQVVDYHISTGVWGAPEFPGFVDGEIGRVGVIAHETGHFLGLPDLYDSNGGGEGVGSWALMANSWGFDGEQWCPGHMTPWSKATLGWINPAVISTAGQYFMNQAETSPDAYRIDQGFPSGEYLMIENRQPVGLDCSLPQGGALIWHIDESASDTTEGYPGQAGWPGNGAHYRVALLQADGNYDLERGNNAGDAGDVHHGAGVDAITEGPGGHPNTDAYQGGVILQTGNTIQNISTSGPSMSFCLNGCSTLDAPSGLVATAIGSDRIDVGWTDNTSTETGFELQHSSDGANWSLEASLGADSTAYSDTGLASGSTHFYRVRAVDAVNVSDWSNVDSATTADQPPAAPGNLQAIAVSQSQIDLDWQDNANNESAYRVEYSAGGVIWNTLVMLTANTTGYSHTGLSAGQTVHYRVFATNSFDSDSSNVASATTLAAPAVTDFVAYDDMFGSGEVFGTYVNTHADDYTGGAGEIQRFVEQESGGKKRDRFSYMGHFWRFNINGGDSVTLFANAWRGPTGDNDDFIFAWSDDNVTYTDLFTVSSESPGNTQSAALPNSLDGELWIRVIDTNRSPGTAASRDELFVDHLFIRVENDGIPNAPAAPAGPVATATGKSSIRVDWTDGSGNEDGFGIERSDDGVSGWTTVGSVGANVETYSDTGLLDDTTYHYRVFAFNGIGNSDATSVVSATTDIDQPPPADPTNLTASDTGSSSIRLDWDDNATNESAYQVHRSTDNVSFAQVASVGGASFEDTGLTANTTYWYKVRAINVEFELSNFSNTASATTQDAPPPSEITLTTSGEKVQGRKEFTLDWSGATSANVDVYRDGNLVTTTANDGNYSYNSGLRGGGSHTHQVCEAGTNTCSNTTSTAF